MFGKSEKVNRRKYYFHKSAVEYLASSSLRKVRQVGAFNQFF